MAEQATGKCLLLGAGLVSGPFITYTAKKGHQLVVATRTKKKADDLIKGLGSNVTAVEFDIEKQGADEELNKLVQETDCVVSLLPWTLHMKAARVAMKHSKHFCTSSYVSDDMRSLHAEAVEKKLVMVNECGVDPGLDHMSAKKLIDEIHAKNGRIVGFTSMCGGLPSPDANNNPFGYKLSWSPRGVLLATGKRDAKFYENDQTEEIPGCDVFKKFKVITVPAADGLPEEKTRTFEQYPNGDSTKYKEILGLKDCKNLVRGTYRNLGWCKALQQILDLGLLEMTQTDGKPHDWVGKTYLEFTAETVGAQEAKPDVVKEAAKKKLCVADDGLACWDHLAFLGLLDGERKVADEKTRLDAVCVLFNEKLQYAPGEKDMICMHHRLEVEYGAEDSPEKETVTSTMTAFGGVDGQSAMARTVCLPLAIAVHMVLTKQFTVPGITIPTIKELYNPILGAMAEEGVHFREAGSAKLGHAK